jgi:prolycopene isomerase
MSTRAERIEVSRGRARGVRLQTLRGGLKGSWRVEAGAVVSNADLRLTVDRLLGPELVDPAYRASIDALRPSFPCFLSHIGLKDVSSWALEQAQGYYWNDWDPDCVGRGGLRCKIFAPTLYEPRMAPDGGQVVILQKVLDMDYHGVDDWSKHKASIERYVTDQLERVVPGIAEKIVVQTSASALTSWRFTNNDQGAMLGWEMSPDQLGDSRPEIEGPVDGLYLVGHWTRPGGGITPVIISAMLAAEELTQSRTFSSREASRWSGGHCRVTERLENKVTAAAAG